MIQITSKVAFSLSLLLTLSVLPSAHSEEPCSLKQSPLKCMAQAVLEELRDSEYPLKQVKLSNPVTARLGYVWLIGDIDQCLMDVESLHQGSPEDQWQDLSKAWGKRNKGQNKFQGYIVADLSGSLREEKNSASIAGQATFEVRIELDPITGEAKVAVGAIAGIKYHAEKTGMTLYRYGFYGRKLLLNQLLCVPL